MKLLLVGVTIISVIFLIQTVTSYTSAVVHNEARIKVTDQEHALISIIADDVVKITPGTTNEFTVKISNRVSKAIHLDGQVKIVDGISFSYEATTLNYLNGDYQPLQIKVETDMTAQELEGANIFQIPFHFNWETGEATIPTEIKIALNENK